MAARAWSIRWAALNGTPRSPKEQVCFAWEVEG
jgi:hypothetical protein